MKIVKALHITAAERKHLKVFIESGMTSAKVNTKHYTKLQQEGNLYTIRISTPKKNDYGKRYMDNQTVEILY